MSENNTSVLDGIAFFILAISLLLGFVLLGFLLTEYILETNTFLTVSVNLKECKIKYVCTSVSFYIVFLAVILLTVIICFTVYLIKSDSYRLRSNKLDSLKENYKEMSEKLHSEKYTDKTLTKTTTDASGKSETTKEYYPSDKAAVDLYKAYSSAVVDV